MGTYFHLLMIIVQEETIPDFGNVTIKTEIQLVSIPIFPVCF